MSQEKKSLRDADQLTLFPADSLASRSPLPEEEKALRMKGSYGEKCTVSFAKLNHDGFWLKMSQGYCQLMLDGRLEEFSETWPKAGTVFGGIAYLQVPSAPLTNAIECGLWATPTTIDGIAPKTDKAILKEMTETRKGRTNFANLRDQVVRGKRMWPTPTASDWKNVGTKEAAQKYIDSGHQIKIGTLVQLEHGGSLNPTWVEWLMGLPSGWSDLNCLETAKSLSLSSGLGKGS